MNNDRGSTWSITRTYSHFRRLAEHGHESAALLDRHGLLACDLGEVNLNVLCQYILVLASLIALSQSTTPASVS